VVYGAVPELTFNPNGTDDPAQVAKDPLGATIGNGSMVREIVSVSVQDPVVPVTV